MTEYGVPVQTLHRWQGPGRVDAGLAEGVTSAKGQALRDAHRCIKELEEGLGLVKAASKMLDAEPGVEPKGIKTSRCDSSLAPVQQGR